MQLEDAYKFSHAATLGPPCPQLSQQTLIDWRPTLPPTTDGLGVVESARALFQQRQIVQRIENVLLLLVASRVAGNDTVQAKDVNAKGVGLDYQLLRRLVGRHRVAVGVKLDLTEAIERYRFDDTALENPVQSTP